MYTRNGVFEVNSQGQLVTPDGLAVFSATGPIAVPLTASFDAAQRALRQIDETIGLNNSSASIRNTIMMVSPFTSATGMPAQQTVVAEHDVTANNLANVDATGFKRSQVEFQDLLYQTVNNTQNPSPDDRTTALNQQIGELQWLNSSLATPLGSQSSQAQFLSNQQTRTTNLQTNLQQDTSTLQSTDMATAIVQLQQQQELYQAGLQPAAGLNKLSLSNFIAL